ncbi:olfactory receptor 10J5-like [Genypterus blacodes]|uniref:olfactory receptor 10J5-like n=1 Tax=Genypterus blacodes TaxID=154954 RepID=UPI003F76D3C7
MKNNSSLTPFYFHFTLFSDYGAFRYLFFFLCLLLYMFIISANVLIIVTVCLEKSLHQPMYILISSLCINSLYGSAGFFPRFLMDLLSDTHLISRPSCFTQIYVVYTYASYELTLLSAMSYDRYVAICHPLHYHRKMSFRLVRDLLLFAWIYPVVSVGFCLHLTIRLPLCGNKIPRLSCSNWPVVQLSCVDTTMNNIAGLFLTIITIFLPFVFVLYSYLRILIVCRRSSSEFRGKALQTCLPHIVTFVNYCISLFSELSLSRLEVDEIDPFIIVVLSLAFLIIPPTNNPLMYGLSLPQIRTRIVRIYRLSPMFT